MDSWVEWGETRVKKTYMLSEYMQTLHVVGKFLNIGREND